MRPARTTVFLSLCLCVFLSCQWSVVGGQFPTDDCKLKTENSRVLLDFYADWCGPCQTVKPVVDSLASEGYAVRRVNVNENKELAARYGVESIPCFIVLERGREVSRVVGPTTIERLKLMYRMKPVLPPSAVGPPPSAAPHPAWRYERPAGHRAALVRVYCQDDAQTRSIGSGTLVRWGERVAVLTARHVVKDAKTIIVELCTKKAHRAKLLAIDPVWDCAVLELDGEPLGVQPADVERGGAAMQTAGNRLESCGYGADGQLACNSGLFLSYKRSNETPNGPDDWFTISGHARQGDSGGGVFNEQGKLVGVLWGTDGQEVVCVQAGRLQKLLDTAIVRTDAAQQKSILQRVPTPAMPAEPFLPGPVPYEPTGGGASVSVASGARPPALPWRRDQVSREEAQQAEIEALIRLEQQRSAADSRVAAPTPPRSGAAAEGDKCDAKAENGASPLGAGLVILGSLAIGGAFYSLTKKKT